MTLLLWLACGGAPPELVSEREALARWEVGRAALEAGDAEQALAAFAHAREGRPGDPLLGAWEAAAMARLGRLDDAVVRLDEVLRGRPDFAIARYNRAAYLLRSDRVEEAAPDLRRAIAEGAATVGDAVRDPDVRPHLGHPLLSFLPDSPLRLTVEPPPERVFRGSEARLTLRVEGVGAAPVAMRGEVSGAARVTSVVEERWPEGEGAVSWQITLVVEGPGPVRVGPLSVAAGDDQSTLPAVAFEGVGPEGGVARVSAVPSPSALAAGWPLDAPRRADGRVWVRAEPASQVSVRPSSAPEVRLELREGGRPAWIAWGFGGVVDHVLVKGVGGARFDGPVPEG